MSTTPSTPSTYHRCLHCKGFYETSLSACKWCKYETPLLNPDGKPKIFPDRETCRAIQIAEWEQLPDKLKDDPMGPPPSDLALLCNCLHCGPEGHVFEAVEMRWMDNEQMWACPCTTCGGRGFQFDIHSAQRKWQCAQCGHFYTPKNDDYRPENAHCPQCGCKNASGWFDDGYDESEFDEENFDDDDEQFERKLGKELEDELDAELDQDESDKKSAETFPARASRDQSADVSEDEIPFAFDLDEDDEDDDDPEYDLGITWKESDQDDDELMFSSSDDEIPFGDVRDDKIPDDIDHPRFFRSPDDKRSDEPFNEDDIPF
jgi:hypothetical protein